jgi:hypothetical protein|tara:strand:+ start:2133 stop:3149 length:1017 start_codon:yes stop_codon:yes gene_type:complete
MNLRKTLRKTLLENTSNTTAYYCCDDSDLLACNAGGPYYDPYINQNNVIALNMYSPGSPLNIIYGTAFPQGYPYNPWSSIQDYQDWCNDPMVPNQSGQVGAWCDVVVDSVTSYPVKCGGMGIDTFGDTVSMKKPETRKGFQDDVEELRRKGRRRSQSHGYGCDCGDGNYDKTCCTGLSESKQCKSGMYWCKKSEKCKPINKSKRKIEQTTSGAAGAFSQPVFGKTIKRKIAEQTLNIKESEFIKLIEKSVYAATHGKIIKEALTDADEKRIGVLARKELKDYETKLEKKVDQAIKKALKGKDFETSTLKITRNAIIQLYKALWIRRSFWTDYIKNTPS